MDVRVGLWSKLSNQRTDAFELWCWRRLLRVPWTVACQALCPWNSAGKKLLSNQFFFSGEKKKTKQDNLFKIINRLRHPVPSSPWGAVWSTPALDSSSASIPSLNTFTHPEPGVQLTECPVFLTKRRLLNGFFPLSDTHVHYPHLLPTLFI